MCVSRAKKAENALSELLEYHPNIPRTLDEALEIYAEEDGIEVGFAIAHKQNDVHCSSISKGSKTESLGKGIEYASVKMDWKDKPLDFEWIGSFHTHPAGDKLSISPSCNDLMSLVVLNFMAIGQTLLNGKFALLIVSRGEEKILLDEMFRGERLAEVPIILDGELIVMNGKSFFTQAHYNRYLASLGCDVYYYEFDDVKTFRMGMLQK